MLQKSQDRHKISFTFEFNNKNIKKVFRANLPPPIDIIKLDLPPNIIRVKCCVPLLQGTMIWPKFSYYFAFSPSVLSAQDANKV